MPSASVRLFVYGSLKRGGRHHEELAGARFLGLAETEPGYHLDQLGEYLALVRSPNAPGAPNETAARSALNELSPPNETVPGELFEVEESRLQALDAFEGAAYCRAELRVRVRVPDLFPRCEQSRDHSQTRHELQGAVFALAYLKKAR